MNFDREIRWPVGPDKAKTDKPVSSPLGRKLLFFILLFSSVVTLVGTSVQLTIEYRNDIGNIHEQLDQLEKGYLKSLTRSLWHLDDTQIEIELNNMLSLQDVVALEITDAEKTAYKAGKVAPDQRVIRRSYAMTYSLDGKEENIGILHATATLGGAYQRLGRRILVVLVTQAIKTFIVSFFILIVIHWMVTRHLGVMAGYVQKIDPGKGSGDGLSLERKGRPEDELEEVVGAINGMEKRLHEDIEKRRGALAELKESEKKVRQSQSLLKTVLSSLDEVVLLIAPEARVIVDCNDTIEQILGYNREEIVGRDTNMLHVDEHAARQFDAKASAGISEKGFFTSELAMKRKDGAIIHTEQYQIRIRRTEDIPELDVSIIRDVSKRKDLESRLRQSHKMEAIGTLAGGIAHDFNNILTVIMGNAELAVQDLAPDTDNRHLVKEIYKASMRAKEVVAQLLKFSKKIESDHIFIDPTLIVSEIHNLMRASIPSNISIEQSLGQDIWTILADPTQIHQIILNLCTNAIHAMESRTGRLVMRLANITMDVANDRTIPRTAPGKYVQLEISDTGEGISEENLAKIFDPYFTTKAMDKGTGLGLSVVQGIVTNHGGSIAVESRLGEGTMVRVYFPAHDAVPLLKSEQPRAAITCNGNILLVDDEPQVAQLGQAMLEQMGYTVEMTVNPREALELIRKNPSRMDLLMTDLSMPGLSGLELAQSVHDLRPDVPIILCSGFTIHVDPASADFSAISYILDKPFTSSTLSNALRQAMDCKTASPEAMG